MEIFPETAAQIRLWSSRPEVLGVLLVGSKSRGYNDELSDDDLEVVLESRAHARLEPSQCLEVKFRGEGESRKLVLDAQYITPGDLEEKARSTHDLAHWPYEKAQVLFDRDGSVAEAVAAVRRMDPEFRAARLRYATVDAWIARYRADKALRRGQEGAARLLVARGVRGLTRVIFALEGRWVPLDHWWERELQTLEDSAVVGPLLVEALVSGSHVPVGEALDRLEDALFEEGVPRPAGRRDLFLKMVHPSSAEERAVHSLSL